MPLIPVALYGLEVPCDGTLIPAVPDFPSTFRITMAAIDPNDTTKTSKSDDDPQNSRATLKIIREVPVDDSSDDEDESDNDSSSADDSEEDSEEENAGPSDSSKTKKAKKAAALQKLIDSVTEVSSDEEMKDAPNSSSKKVKSPQKDKKGKSKATDDESIDGDSDDDEDDDEEKFEENVLCTLDSKSHYQQSLDITIGENELVYFQVVGGFNVHLTGNYVIADDEHKHGEYDSDEDEDYDLSPDEDELEIGMEEESDELDTLENPRITEVDSADEEVPKLVKAAEKKKGKNKRPADDLNEENSLDNLISKSTTSSTIDETKLSKKQLKKLKKNNGDAVSAKVEDGKKDDTDKSDKGDKKVQFAKKLEQGPTNSSEKTSEKGKPESNKNQKKESLGVKTIDGIKIDDKKLGSGRVCKKGDKVSMRYIGKLVNGSVFDSNKKGTPFSFKLGGGEVIRGWDIGVAGMSAGGERRLTIPPNKGYGSKGLPGIPANSTLIFDIKLLEIK
ncbi:FK506-binding protein 4 [Podosphaera aphanis]|nr:FK506-binding protein 4 [Podosphaera aphanis]